MIDPNDDKKNNAINADLTFKPHYQKVPDVKSEQRHEDSIIVSDSKSENKASAVSQVNKSSNGSSIQLGMDNDSKANKDVPDHKSDLGMQSKDVGSDHKSGKISIDNKRALKDLQDMLK